MHGIKKMFFVTKRGFTLIELMVSIIIASLLSLAVYMVYTATKKSSTHQEGISEIRDVSFVVLERLDYALKHAGFMNYDESSGNIFNANNNFPSLDATRNIYTRNSNDQLAIQFRIPQFNNGKELLACGGGNFPSPINYAVNYQMVFSVADAQLRCQVLQNGTPPLPGAFSVLADNVLRFKVFYQKRLDPAKNDCDSNWLRQTDVTDWDSVCSVYVAMVVASSAPFLQANAPAQTFELAPDPSNPSLVRADDTTFTLNAAVRPAARMIHKVVYLRN